MKVGLVEIGKTEVIAIFMLLCLVTAAFFMGVYWSYSKATDFANREIKDKSGECILNKEPGQFNVFNGSIQNFNIDTVGEE